MSKKEEMKGVDFERVRGALSDVKKLASAAVALGMSVKTLRRRLHDERIFKSEYNALVDHLGAPYYRYLSPALSVDHAATAQLYGRWATSHFEYVADADTGEEGLRLMKGVIDIKPAKEPGDPLVMTGEIDKEADPHNRKEIITKAWNRSGCLMFESILEGWPHPCGVGMTQMFITNYDVMRGFTTFFDEILDKPFYSPHIAVREGQASTPVQKQLMVWFSKQEKALRRSLELAD